MSSEETEETEKRFFCLKEIKPPKGKERETEERNRNKKCLKWKESETVCNEFYFCAVESSVSVLFYNELC